MERSSKIEISTRKPGNVDPQNSSQFQVYQDFIKAADTIANKTRELLVSSRRDNKITIGKYIFEITKAMIDVQTHGNVLLGHILLFAPLVLASNSLINTPNIPQNRSWDYFWKKVSEIIENSSYEDSVLLARAIIYSKAGGLKNPGGKPFEGKHDFTKPDVFEQIRINHTSLKELFAESAHYDSISQEYITNYEFSRNVVLNWLKNYSKGENNPKYLTTELFFTILAIKPDSLIYRKNNQEIAQKIQDQADIILKKGGPFSPEGKILVKKMQDEMEKANGKLNPGTTADLTACIIFIGQLFRIIEFIDDIN